MSQSRYSWTEPALCHYNYSFEHKWFVYFDYTDHLSFKTIRKQFRAQINKGKTKDARMKIATTVRLYWKGRLEGGWNPFMDADTKKLPIHYTISEALEEILKVHLPGKKPKTKDTYNYVVKLFKEWLVKQRLSDIMVSLISNGDATRYMDSLMHEKGFAGRTHNDHLIVLATLFNAMAGRSWIAKNPFHKIARREVQVGRNIAFSDKEKEELKKVLKRRDEQLYYFTQIMYFTFIRRTELARLRVRDFDLVNKTIVIPSDVSKNGEQESVVIPVGLEQVLGEMRLEHYPSDYFVFGRHLFTSDLQYTNVCHITTRHNKFIKELKIDKLKTLYSWKHSGVCAAYYATGKDVYALMRQLRHKSLETTMIYLKSLGLVQNDVFRNAMVA